MAKKTKLSVNAKILIIVLIVLAAVVVFGGVPQLAKFSAGLIPSQPLKGFQYEICGDSKDNDLNGLIDCADPACARNFDCVYTPKIYRVSRDPASSTVVLNLKSEGIFSWMADGIAEGIDAWGYNGWGNCSSQNGGLDMADKFCKLEGFLGIDSSNPCYHEPKPHRAYWTINLQGQSTCSYQTSGSDQIWGDTYSGIAFTQVRCVKPKLVDLIPAGVTKTDYGYSVAVKNQGDNTGCGWYYAALYNDADGSYMGECYMGSSTENVPKPGETVYCTITTDKKVSTVIAVADYKFAQIEKDETNNVARFNVA